MNCFLKPTTPRKEKIFNYNKTTKNMDDELGKVFNCISEENKLEKTLSELDYSADDESEVAVKNIPAESAVDNISVDGSFSPYYYTHDLEKNRYNLSPVHYNDGTPNPSVFSPGTPADVSEREKRLFR